MVHALRGHRQQQLERSLMLGLGRPPDDALVFPGNDGGYQAPRAFTMRWTRVAARIGMPEIRWHSLRHAHASMLSALGWSIPHVAKRLGHANSAVTLKVYTHLFDKDDSAAVAALDQALG